MKNQGCCASQTRKKRGSFDICRQMYRTGRDGFLQFNLFSTPVPSRTESPRILPCCGQIARRFVLAAIVTLKLVIVTGKLHADSFQQPL